MFLAYMDFVFVVDGKVIYERITPADNIPKSGGGLAYHIIKLPEEIKDKTIYMSFEAKLKLPNKYSISEIELGEKNDIISKMLKKDAFGLVLP